MAAYALLLIAVIGEIIGSSALKASEGFTKLVPSLLVVVGYGVAFYFFSLTLKYIPLGICYAIWTGIGTALTVLVGVLYWKETLAVQHIAGIVLIMLGVVVINLTKGSLE
ncbi:DMT family transporter [Anaeroselena agilis]|uniref:Multidrug efflux SMR transporter n=1 Tax=Anaeroselena agilis TaxID=3063788 RepID=A0ABU3NS32_9FIRM|nr:multidrug efflux SMR transporter [Selenomonadales bacterium 4137-cl]